MLQTMLAALLTYPHIDPVLVAFGPLVIRWYALAYISGLLLGWFYMVHLAGLKKAPLPKGKSISRSDIDDFIMWATLGIILGGRLGYVLFYNAPLYMSDPSAIIKVWQGGMSFHGGLLGVALAIVLFARQRKIPLMVFADLVACAAPIGLFFGRLANFVNGELWGRVADVPWAMIFPDGGPLPRHPSELYEAGLEGLTLFTLLWLLATKTGARAKPGLLTGVFLAGYASARMFVEQFREPDEQLGFLFGHVTMGQLLSLPMFLIGAALIARQLMKKPQKPA
jgi:phosphatidylglycerol:prolipoprotein diacylglycerol transferase